MLFSAAKSAGVERIVHVSIANPSIESPLPYFKGKALVEYALARSGLPYSIVRPTWIFGGERDVLTNNIAWILRRMPVFALPGSGSYPVQPVHVDDLARICIDAAGADGDLVFDAAGPERMPFRDFIALVRSAVNARSPIVHVPPPLNGSGGACAWPARPRRGTHAGRDQRSHGRTARRHTTPLSDRSRSASGLTNTRRPSVAPTPTN